MVKQTDAGSFDQEVLNNPKPTLVDFWAEWCGPCKALAPTLEEIGSEYSEKIEVFKVEVDTNQELAQKYGIRSIPTMMIFKEGKVVETLVGNVPKSDIETSINKVL
ncbi:MAG: thioredoxin [Bacteriovoracaceae bacterium]